MTKPPLQFPSRLAENNDRAGRLLRESLEDSSRYPSECSSWQGLMQKRERPSRQLGVPAGYVLALIGACAMAVIWRLGHDPPSIRLLAQPEAMPTFVGASAPKNLDASPATRAPAEPVLKARHLPPTQVEERPRETAPGNTGVEGPSALRQLDVANETSKSTSVCAAMARKGELAAAADCYGQIGRGSDMAAELALYEKARLESRALGRGATALATLDEHAKRFPRGALSTEAGLTRIELLTRLGRTNDALSAIDEALLGPMGLERGGDLYALRGELLARRGDCSGANAAFGLARSRGVSESRPLTGEKRCAESAREKDATPNTAP